MPEGTPFFENEAVIEVVAPMEEAQLVETLAINQIGFPSLIASKAARIVAAAQGRRVIDFGGRRAHGIDAAVTGARAAYIGGADATANVYAGRRYGVPSPAPWRTASSSRSTTRWTRSAPSRASIRRRCFWSTPTIRSRA